MMEDCGDCCQNYKWELDQAFRATGDRNVDENMRVNILKGIGVPKAPKEPPSEDESTDSDVGEVFDHKVDVLVDPECGYACEKDLGWFDLVLSHSPWDEARRPYDELIMYEDLTLTDNEKEGELSGMIMATGMTVLDSVPMRDGFALTKLHLPDKGLKNIQLLDSYKFIQYVDVSHNTIEDLTPLDRLTYLMALDASHNQVDYFRPNPTPWFLSYLNLSHNQLTTVPYIMEMWSLKHLDLSNNKITKIKYIKDLSYLEYVNLNHNSIKVLENISNVPLKTLDVSWNQITHCEENSGLQNIITLQRLDISHNHLSSMSDIQCINTSSLRHLNIAYNNFNSVTAFDDIARYKSLRYLRLEENSIVHSLPEIVKNILHLLPQLAYVNGQKLTKTERMGAFSMWNTDPIVREMKKYCYDLLYSNVEPPEYGEETAAHLDYNIPIVILTGPMGCKKFTLVKYIADRYPEYVRRPVLHSTWHDNSNENPEVCEEFQSLNVHHVEESEFNRMWNRGEFVFVHNTMGDLCGLGRNELQDDGRLLLMALPIQPALSLKWQGLKTTFILVKPSSDEDYSDALQKMIVTMTTIRRERDEAKEIQALPNVDQEESVTSYPSQSSKQDEEEEDDDALLSGGSNDSLKKRGLQRSQEKFFDPFAEAGDDLQEPTSLQALSISALGATLDSFQHITMPRFASPEARTTWDIPFWCSEESLDDDEEEEIVYKHIPYIENLKTHAGEKEKLWSLYHIYYSEAKFYYEDLVETCGHLFVKTVVIDDMDRAMKKILPLLVEEYNASLKPYKEDEQDPLYDVLVKPRLDEMMGILADRGFIGTSRRPEGGDTGSSEPSKDTLSVPFFSPSTSSLGVTPSTSSTDFGSEERQLEEPRDVWGRPSPPTPPETPSTILENVAKESMKRAGFVTHQADHAIKYYHSQKYK